MPLRDLVLVLIVFGSVPFILFRPYVGILLWAWLGFMNPHRLSWGFAYDLPFAQVIAIATLLGLVFTKQRRAIPVVLPTVLLAAFWTVTAASTLGALYPEPAWRDFNLLTKIVLMTFVMLALVQTRDHLRYLIMVAAFSIAYYGVKGAIWAVLTGGEHGWVLGPYGSFLGDNNGLALALNMTLPLLFFLSREEPRRWLRFLLVISFILSILALPFTYSRGGFLGLVLVLFLLVIRTRWKLIMIPAAVGAVMVGLSYLPERWFDRIATITRYAEDTSATSRLYAWEVGWRLALDYPLLGGGFRVFPHPEIWAKYAPDWTHAYGSVHNAHSIYFHVLGEHGFIGFALYFALIVSTLITLLRIRRRARRLHSGTWMIDYSRMVETSLYAFLLTGIFYNMSHFDLFYFLVGVTIILWRLVTTASSVPDRSETISTKEDRTRLNAHGPLGHAGARRAIRAVRA